MELSVLFINSSEIFEEISMKKKDSLSRSFVVQRNNSYSLDKE